MRSVVSVLMAVTFAFTVAAFPSAGMAKAAGTPHTIDMPRGYTAVPVIGDVTKASMDFAARKILDAVHDHADTVYMRIDSDGGDIRAAIKVGHLMDALRDQHTRFVCFGGDKVMSAAFFLMQHCDERLGTKDTKFMTHEPWTAIQGNRWAMIATAKALSEDADEMAQVIGQRLHMGVKNYEKVVALGDLSFGPEGGLKLGAIDGVVPASSLPRTYELPKLPALKIPGACECE
jgi:ATP-dependent protease ClpP protease subunit